MQKQKIKSTIILLALFNILYSNAQYGNVNRRQPNANFEANLAVNNILRSRNVLQEVINQGKNSKIAINKIEGEPYFKKTFANGNIMYKDSLSLGTYLMRYNAFTDEIEVKNGTTTNVINKADYIRITLDGKKYVLLNFETNKSTNQQGFFIEKLKDSFASLYLRQYKTIKQGQEAKTSFHENTPSRFIDHEMYFLKFGNNLPLPVKLRKKIILKSFPNKNKELKEYVSEKKLNIETENDLISLITYYNSLQH